LKSKFDLIFTTLLITTFALWFGGFTFYVSFVVPIGTDILGSARRQGFITQQVTHRLNVVCAFAVLVMLIESYRTWRHRPISFRATMLAMTVLIGLMLIGLVGLHPHLDALVDWDKQRVLDRAKFYGLHRIYLWVSTFQWLVAWIWIFIWVARNRPNVAQQPYEKP